jgi:hypothetical protein
MHAIRRGSLPTSDARGVMTTRLRARHSLLHDLLVRPFNRTQKNAGQTPYVEGRVQGWMAARWGAHDHGGNGAAQGLLLLDRRAGRRDLDVVAAVRAGTPCCCTRENEEGEGDVAAGRKMNRALEKKFWASMGVAAARESRSRGRRAIAGRGEEGRWEGVGRGRRHGCWRN